MPKIISWVSIASIVALFALALIRPGVGGEGDTTQQSEYVFVLSAIIILGILVYEKTNALFAVSFTYFSYSALWVHFDKTNCYVKNEAFLRSLLARGASSTLIMVMLAALVLLACKLDYEKIRFWIAGISIGNCLLVFCHWVFGDNIRPGLPPTGLIDVPGINAGFIAATIPAVLYAVNYRRPNYLYTALSVLAVSLTVWKSGGSNAHGVLAVSLITFMYFLFKKDKKFFFCSAFVVFAAVVSMGFFFLGDKFLDDSFRFQAYKVFMGYWYKELSFFTGSGLGTFRNLGPAIQMQTGFMVNLKANYADFYLSLHSDWLQILFETGAIGLTLAVSLFISSLWKLRNSPVEFSILMGLASFMVFYYPLHWVHSGLLAAYVVILSQKKEFGLGTTLSCKNQMLAATLRG